jgi:hypothetical protein
MDQKWYRWDKNNKKLLLMAMTNSTKPIKIKFSETFVINFPAALAVSGNQIANVEPRLGFRFAG